MIPLNGGAAGDGGGQIAIIDIGSNSIRLVVYHGASRAPVPIFNEKVVCALGEGLELTGRLSEQGVAEAMVTLGRFVGLARAMKVAILDIVATAAVRDASDGAKFIEMMEKRHGVTVTTLSGEEEAKLAALGVLCGVPDADGTIADLGGGSVELVALDHGRLAGPFATMKLGVLRLAEASGNDRARAAALIESQLEEIDWFGWGRARPLYAVGGAWRALARLFVAQTGHPLQVLDNFTLERADAFRLLELLSHQSRKSIDKIPGLSRKRVPYLPLAALLLERILQRLQPSYLAFSVYGMREGRFFGHLPPDVQWQDPLITACQALARSMGRFPEHGDEILEWMTSLFPDEAERQTRLRCAACLLGDIFWGEHPDYRAEQAFLRVFRLPFMGLGHHDRAALALSVYYRYEGEFQARQVGQAIELLSEDEQRRALLIGLSLRLAHSVSGGVPGLLGKTRLFKDEGTLVLELPGGSPIFGGDFNERRYERLARAAGQEKFDIRWI